MNLEEIITSFNSLLNLILAEKDEKVKRMAVMKFDDIIFNYEGIIVNDEIDDIMITLANDLEYYEPDSSWRKESSFLYGDDRAVLEIKNALEKIKGCKTPGTT